MQEIETILSLFWLQNELSELILNSPENRLVDFDELRIFDRPLIGVADGFDDYFEQLKYAVSPRHMHPSDLIISGQDKKRIPGPLRVLVWVLPYTQKIRESNIGGREPSLLYSIARNNGGAFNFFLRRQLAKKISSMGFQAIVPLLTATYDAFRYSPFTFSSSWSERHVAFIAGLGQFGLNANLITSVGAHVRIGSLVTDAPFDITPRASDDYRAECLRTAGAACSACISNCPVQAISAKGLDKERCYVMRKAVRKKYIDHYRLNYAIKTAPVVKSGRRSEGYSLGCALCQCGVPCENSNPFPVE